MTTIRVFPQPGPILDYIWYPTATPHDPASFCFVASVRECPVKLLDASDGRVRPHSWINRHLATYQKSQLRASYKIVDHRERQIAPHSLAFNLTAQKLVLFILHSVEVPISLLPDSIVALRMPSRYLIFLVQEKVPGYTRPPPKRARMG